MAVTPHTTPTITNDITVAGIAFLTIAEAHTPMLPIKSDITIINTTNWRRSAILIPPIVNIIDTTGRLEKTRSTTMLMDDISFPITICPGFNTVVSSISRVCFSRSPAMLPAVNTGTKNATIAASIQIITKYTIIAAE